MRSLKKYSMSTDESGNTTIKKKTLFGEKSMTIGSNGVSAKNEGLLSNTEASIGSSGVAYQKDGLLTHKAASVGTGGVVVERDDLLTHKSASVDSSGVNVESDGLLTHKAASVGTGGAAVESDGLLTHKSASVDSSGVNVENDKAATVSTGVKGVISSVFAYATQDRSKSVGDGSGRTLTRDSVGAEPFEGAHQRPSTNPAWLVGKWIVVKGRGTGCVTRFNKVTKMNAIMMKNSTHTIRFSDCGREVSLVLSRYKQLALNQGTEWYYLYAEDHLAAETAVTTRGSSSAAR